MCNMNSKIFCASIIAMAQTFLFYEDLRRNGVHSSEANSLQYCFDVELIRPHQFCEACYSYMQLKTCSRRGDGSSTTATAGPALKPNITAP